MAKQEKTRRKTQSSLLNENLLEHGKIPPQAIELEEAVLGSIMLEKDALTTVIDFLSPEVFYKDNHRIIFETILTLFKESEPVDILTVTNALRDTGELELVGGAFYITQLTNRVASTANIEYHSRILLQKYMQRELIKVSAEVIRDAYEDSTDVFDLLDRAEQNLFSISERNFRRDYSNLQLLVKEAIRDIEKANDPDSGFSGIPSGFTQLDRITAGWQKSDLIILAARPGMGKTAFVLSMARNIAVGLEKPVAFFSLEMSAVQLVTRLISSESGLDANKLKRGDLKEYEWEQLKVKVDTLMEAPLFIDDTPALSIFELRAKARRLKSQHDIQMIIIDYIQLMSTGEENKGNREQEISQISRSLKGLAKELNVPIISLSQLNRSVETRGGSKRPILSDLRESGAIEQDADLVLFIYRPEYYQIATYEDGTSTQGKAEIIIAKHRNGALADVKLKFIGKYAKFTQLDDEDFYLEEDDSLEDGDNTVTIPSKMNDVSDEGTPY